MSKVDVPDSHLPYVINAPAYVETNGGAIFMHGLVHHLNMMGEKAYLSPMKTTYKLDPITRVKWFLRPPPYTLAPSLTTPLAPKQLFQNPYIVVYPELVRGNPLNAPHVARWLLYTPGVLHPYEFGTDEMFFRVGEVTDLPQITGGAPDLLLWQVNRTYRNMNNPDRKGVCYIVRKGKHKPRIAETEAPDAIQVDGMSHTEMNEVFNRCETFISYDEATMYSQYAAISGCKSIVIPGIHTSRAQWVANHKLATYGVAYGMDDVSHAIETRDKVLPLLEAEEARGIETVKNFIAITQRRAAGSK